MAASGPDSCSAKNSAAAWLASISRSRWPRLRAADRSAVGVAQLDPDPVGQPLDRLGERQVVDLLHEGDDVAALAAAEAVEEPAGRGDLEARGLLVVEGAQALQRAAAGVAQGDVGADDLVDPGPFPDGRDVLVVDPSRHGPSVCPPRAPSGVVIGAPGSWSSGSAGSVPAAAGTTEDVWGGGRGENQQEHTRCAEQPGPSAQTDVEDQQDGTHHDERDPGDLEPERDVAEPDDRGLEQLVEQGPMEVRPAPGRARWSWRSAAPTRRRDPSAASPATRIGVGTPA